MMYNLWLCIKEYNQFIPLLRSLEPNNKEKFLESREYTKSIIEQGWLPENKDFEVAKEFVYWLSHSFSGDINGGMSKVNSHISMLNRLESEKIQRKIDRMTVHNLSYEEIIGLYDSKDTLFYVDPPYYGREHFYGFHPFKVEDHESLSEILKNIEGYFVVSYYRRPEIESMYPEDEFVYKEKKYKRSSSSVQKGNKKEEATELIIMNYERSSENSNFEKIFT